MVTILKKEISSFFSSPIAYLVIGMFLVGNGLFLWVFKGNYNILDNGFADLAPFFTLSPWIFLFLIPAICMKSFSEEIRQGTLELLLTKPISIWQLVLGKYFGAVVLVLLSLIPTLLYVWTIYELGDPKGNFDYGATMGSYMGLLLLGASYAAIGLFASSLTENQIVAFIIGVLLCFSCFFAFDALAEINRLEWNGFTWEDLGLNAHYRSISRGVMDTRDLVYFISFIGFFLALTQFRIKTRNMEKKATRPTYLVRGGLLFVSLILLNLVSSLLYQRIDLTQDQRYTLSEPAREIVSDLKSPIIVDVFLKGDFPSEFRRLQVETRQLLEEFSNYNPQIKFNFVDPLEEGGDANEVAGQFYEMGMTPARINVVERGRSSEAIIFPWAMANYGKNSVKVPLLKNKLGASSEERVSSSIQHLEYAFADAFSKLVHPKRKKVAVMRGNGELPDALIADFARSIQEYYYIAPFTLDSVAVDPQETLEQLKEFDLVIEAKPTQAFSEEEKFVLDQYLMQGGKALWMVEHVSMETDSLFNPAGRAFALPRDLNLGDFFFKYGIRINPSLVNDLYSAPLVLASGSGSNAQFNPFPWFYFPLTVSPNQHPVINNIEAVRFEYANPIDTLRNGVRKTVLLSSSPSTRLEGTPKEISLELIDQEPDVSTYDSGEQPLAVLLEGKFTSVYQDRLKPFELAQPLDSSTETQLLVISDGDVVKNQLQRGEPLELGYDRFTGNTYGNKEFLLNAVNYLLDDTGLIDIRSREVSIAFLDLKKASENRVYWQVVNLLAPLLLLAGFGALYTYLRKRKFARG